MKFAPPEHDGHIEGDMVTFRAIDDVTLAIIKLAMEDNSLSDFLNDLVGLNGLDYLSNGLLGFTVFSVEEVARKNKAIEKLRDLQRDQSKIYQKDMSKTMNDLLVELAECVAEQKKNRDSRDSSQPNS